MLGFGDWSPYKKSFLKGMSSVLSLLKEAGHHKKTPKVTIVERSQVEIEQFLAMLMLKTQSLILGDGHDMVDDNRIIFDDNVVHQ